MSGCHEEALRGGRLQLKDPSCLFDVIVFFGALVSEVVHRHTYNTLSSLEPLKIFKIIIFMYIAIL